MCGRFYVDDDTAKEIQKIVRQMDEKVTFTKRTGDFYPSENAAVMVAGNKGSFLTEKRWGFPGFKNSGLIINARAETVLEKRMFGESVRNRRLVIPVSGFYEWNHEKEKFTFKADDTGGRSSILYLAGFYAHFEGEDRFVIITTQANPSVKEVHDRMPLIFREEEVEEWLLNQGSLEKLLHSVPGSLKKKANDAICHQTSFLV